MNDKKIEFETALNELEEITSKLSGGDLPLKESIRLYERGIELKKICKEKLGEATNKIKILKDEDEEITEEDFEIEEGRDNK
ncbi:MAG: exodeoxyribonuclease VII small subunit [Elusimicrobiota bacterium]